MNANEGHGHAEMKVASAVSTLKLYYSLEIKETSPR
jgi:hypothetical protein